LSDGDYALLTAIANGTNVWIVNVTGYNILRFSAAGIDTSYNVGIYSQMPTSMNIVRPTITSPSNVFNNTNTSVNFTFTEGGMIVKGNLTVQNITFGDPLSKCTIMGNLGFDTSNQYFNVNCTAPNLTLFKYYNLTVVANSSTSGMISATQTNAVYYASSSTCSYPGSGNWQINDNCLITTAIQVGKNNVSANCSNNITIDAGGANGRIYNFTRFSTANTCNVRLIAGGKIG
jgi:hypothetical protein